MIKMSSDLPVFYTKVLFCQNVTRVKLCGALLYEEVRKMLMKLATGLACCKLF